MISGDNSSKDLAVKQIKVEMQKLDDVMKQKEGKIIVWTSEEINNGIVVL